MEAGFKIDAKTNRNIDGEKTAEDGRKLGTGSYKGSKLDKTRVLIYKICIKKKIVFILGKTQKKKK